MEKIFNDSIVLQALITALMAYVAWTWRRALQKFETSITDLYEKYGGHDTRITRVETVHDLKGCDTVDRRKKP